MATDDQVHISRDGDTIWRWLAARFYVAQPCFALSRPQRCVRQLRSPSSSKQRTPIAPSNLPTKLPMSLQTGFRAAPCMAHVPQHIHTRATLDYGSWRLHTLPPFPGLHDISPVSGATQHNSTQDSLIACHMQEIAQSEQAEGCCPLFAASWGITVTMHWVGPQVGRGLDGTQPNHGMKSYCLHQAISAAARLQAFPCIAQCC